VARLRVISDVVNRALEVDLLGDSVSFVEYELMRTGE
jgi:hypothetical protein